MTMQIKKKKAPIRVSLRVFKQIIPLASCAPNVTSAISEPDYRSIENSGPIADYIRILDFDYQHQIDEDVGGRAFVKSI
jgi:hypothetical protein